MNAYVIKSWKAANTPDASGNCVHIVGRAGGLISWLLNLIGVSPTVELTATEDLISFKEGSWGGVVQYNTPLENVCATFYGYTKPWSQAVILGVIFGGATFFLLGIPGIIIAIIYYFLNKTMTVGFTDMGGRASHINFKRSVIEGQKIDEGAALAVCKIVQSMVERRLARPPTAATASTPIEVATPQPAEPEKPADKKYFYADAQSQTKGPFTREELAQLEASGEIKPETFVIAEGASEWSTWETLKNSAAG